MRVLQNNYQGGGRRTVYCAFCQSMLAITEADLRPAAVGHVVHCPCCQRDFPQLSEAEIMAACK